MNKVNLLDDLTANQIAAGEVVERPLSVVKELVENSLDAGALNIVVELKEGGLSQIRVSDDGSGMSKEDCLLAIRRHATSKLRSISDLDSLTTLGFRGEALPSIGSVARLEIVTREKHSLSGTQLIIEGGEILEIGTTGCPPGTTVNVRDLFFNTPARRKFLRSPSYEGGLIHELLLQLSLSQPQVNFRLLNQGKETLNTAAVNSLPDLLTLHYGDNVRKALMKVEGKASSALVFGYLTSYQYHRPNRTAIHFFINKRRVIAKELMGAVLSVYENSLPKGRFPLGVLHINLEPALLDVNIHPSKLEVRLRDKELVFELRKLLQQALQEGSRAPEYRPASFITLPNSPVKEEKIEPTVPAPAQVQEAWQDFFTWKDKAQQHTSQEDRKEAPSSLVQEEKIVYQSQAKDKSESEKCEGTKLPDLEIIGQLDQTFILAQGPEGLYIFDQHVVHERILYEQMLTQNKEGSLESQLLFTPVTLNLTALEEEIVIEHILPITDMGFILEYFGPRCYLLRAIPPNIKEVPEDFFFALLARLSEKTKNLTPQEVRKDIILTASCKGAIKAKEKLTILEMKRLLSDLQNTENPLTCPHGRPIFYIVTHKELLKAFRRL